MKRALILAVLLALAFTLVAACRSEAPAEADPTPTPPAEAQEPDVEDDIDDEPEVIGGWNGWNPFPDGFPDEWYEYGWAERFHLFNDHFTPEDLGGITVRINNAAPESIEDEALRAEMMARRDWVEQSFNITMEFNFVEALFEWAEVPEQVIASFAAGDPVVHAFRGTNSTLWFPQLARAGVLVPDDGWIRDNFPPNWWAVAGEFEGTIYGFDSQFPFAANMGLIYNRPMIQAAGMDMTPSEMFMAGRWSHEDFYEYMSLLNERLPADVVPLAAPHNQLGMGFAFANGTFIKNPATSLPVYLEDPFLEVVRFMQRLAESGIMAPPGFNAEDEVWSWAADFFPPWRPRFHEENSAMVVSQRFQFYESSGYIEHGFVPYPWGSNVQWPASGDWRDLADNGYASFFNAANMFTIVQGSPVNHRLAAYIVFSYQLHDVARRAMIAHAAGEENPIAAPNVQHLFEESDQELWQWYADQAIFEISVVYGLPAGFWSAVLEAIGTGNDVRPGLEAILGEDIFTMLDRELISRADVPAEMLALADEFNV
ncbi:MAG: extracellular solute-binding protein [Defluviitaleaceae bacterium]|nr:extracellular solute-binding protein [Defluviitaleaceae bacterium]